VIIKDPSRASRHFSNSVKKEKVAAGRQHPNVMEHVIDFGPARDEGIVSLTNFRAKCPNPRAMLGRTERRESRQ
jgi:hypothetical protein